MPVAPSYRPAPFFPALGEGFFDVVAPARFPRHALRFRNQRAAEQVGLGALDAAEWEAHFAGFAPLPGNLERPLALRYHGHQFGVYNPHLGDGRGFLFAQMLGAKDGRLYDLGTKGSGQTPWSRGGDGRLTLKGGVREVLATEMLEALGVETSRSFSLFETGEMLFRGDEPSPARSSVLVRLSHSHLRFGSFQRHAYEGARERLKKLFDCALEHYFPDLDVSGAEDAVVAFLREVSARAGRMVAGWMAAGFAHGVLNTDNMNITGESFDYGPYRFVPRYDPEFVAAYFDHTGLYAFGRQARAVVWNLTRLADALRLIAPTAAMAAALRAFEPAFAAALREKFLRRLGLASAGVDLDDMLVEASFGFMRQSQVGYDDFFFDWYGGALSRDRALAGPRGALYRQSASFEALSKALELFSPARRERLSEAYFQGEAPTSLLIDEIESIWGDIAERDDWSRFEVKIAAIRALGALYGAGPEEAASREAAGL